MSNVRSQPDVLADISEKLDSILGFLAIRGIEGDAAKVVIRLRDLGLGPKGIARVAGITENAVSIRLSRMKKPKAGKSSKVGKAGKKQKASSPSSAPAAPTENEEALS